MPTVAPGSVVVVMLTRGAMTIDNDFAGETAPALSLTVTPNVKVPAVRGMPRIAPLVGLSVSPPGRVPVTTSQLL